MSVELVLRETFVVRVTRHARKRLHKRIGAIDLLQALKTSKPSTRRERVLAVHYGRYREFTSSKQRLIRDPDFFYLTNQQHGALFVLRGERTCAGRFSLISVFKLSDLLQFGKMFDKLVGESAAERRQR